MSSIAVALFFFSLLLCLPFPSLPEMHKPGVYTYSDRMYSNLTQILLQIVLRFSVKKAQSLWLSSKWTVLRSSSLAERRQITPKIAGRVQTRLPASGLKL